MKRIFLVTLAVVLAVGMIFAGCAKPAEPPITPTPPTPPITPVKPTPPAAFEWPDMLTFLTHPSTSTGYVATAAWTPVLEADTGMKVRIVPKEGGATRWKWLKSDPKYQLLTLVGPDFIAGQAATKGCAARDAGPFPVTVVWRLLTSGGGPLVRGDSSIKSWADVKPGVRVTYEVGSPKGEKEFTSFLAWAGLTKEDVVVIPGSDKAWIVDLILEGKADICPGAASTSTHTYRAEAGPHGIRYLEMDPEKDPEAAKRYWAVRPDVMFIPLTAGVEACLGVVSPAHPYFYGALPDLDTELVYHLVKWLDENFDRYKDKDLRVVDMGIEPFAKLLDTLYAPTHEGVIKYFQEKGLWTPTRQATHDHAVEVLARYEQAFIAAVAEADGKGIVVDSANDVWLDFWENYKKELGLPLIGAVK